MSRICLYYRNKPETDRFIPGDRLIRPFLRKIFRGRKVSSLEKVFLNLCMGFDELKVDYVKNLPFDKIKPEDKVVVLGIGKSVLAGYNKTNKIIAGIGLMTHPAEWPALFSQYPIAVYLQHSNWTAAIYNRWYGENTCKTWPAGIDTGWWKPDPNTPKTDILVYVKFLWDKELNKERLLDPIITSLKARQLSYKLIEYGSYDVTDYKTLLQTSKAMIFLCEHESQGMAYQEAMAMNVPVFAWDQGYWLDPNRHTWGEKDPVPASSVPFFDEQCGEKFSDLKDFDEKLPLFLKKMEEEKYTPRTYILDNLSLKKSALRMLEIIKETYV